MDGAAKQRQETVADAEMNHEKHEIHENKAR